MSEQFVHLSVHTEYSIVDSIIRIEELFSRCVDIDLSAIAITDRCNMFALVKFYQKAIASGIKPIIGVELWLENSFDHLNPYSLTVLALNSVGYQNILRLVSAAYLKNDCFLKPFIKREWLIELSSGIIVLSGAKDGDLGRALLTEQLVEARSLAKFWKELLPDRYYIEIQRTNRARDEEYLGRAVDLAVEFNLPLVATNAVRFLERSDYEAHEARVCIHNGYILTDPNRPCGYSPEQYLTSAEEMQQLFADLPESLENTVEIAKRCNVELALGKNLLPVFSVSKQLTAEEYFADKARAGLTNRLTEVNQQSSYFERLEYEIKIINQMGYASYFLIVADFIAWAKKNDISVGPGRGSGAGSLVAYALEIVNIDPIKHGLLFERFLNPQRVSLPDIDVDFCMDGRDQVINYVTKRYGKERVSQIITYGTMAAKAVVRDVGRVLGFPYGFVDKLAKLIPFSLGITLDQAMQDEELLRKRYEEERDAKVLIDLAKKLEGIVRNAGRHAGGVVIAPSPLTDYLPLYRETDSELVLSQLDKDDLEKVGLVKFDFLGLRTLTIIDWSVKAINLNRKLQGLPPLDINKIDLEDTDTYRLLQAGITTAVFQLESRISRDVIKRFKPDCFNDIITLVAMIRPGVLQSGMLDEIINRKQGTAKITYLHPALEMILGTTYGVLIYQEQVMQTAQELAGYSLGDADLLRRAMGKKKPEEMAMQRVVFIKGAAEKGISVSLASQIFEYMEKFASYGFNKSHSAAYALLSYQTAWLKTHYPAEFMAAVLSSDLDHTDKIVMFLEECKLLGLKVNKPNLNTSNYHFVVSGNSEILYGLGAIKGVGKIAVDSIISTRDHVGRFGSLSDLCRRVDHRKVNKRALESLIYAGALDIFSSNRAALVASLESVVKYAIQHEKNLESNQLDLLGEWSDSSEEHHLLCFDNSVSDWSDKERLTNERAVLGFYLSGHPTETLIQELNQFSITDYQQLATCIGKTTRVSGIVGEARLAFTKRGKRFAIVNLESTSGNLELAVFDKLFHTCRELLVKNQLLVAEGEVVVSANNHGYELKAAKIVDLEEFRKQQVKRLSISVKSLTGSSKVAFAELLNKILTPYLGGECIVVLEYWIDQEVVKMGLGSSWKVHPKSSLITDLQAASSSITCCYLYK